VVTENGTCTDGNVTIGNETRVLNQSGASFFKNLTMDNRLMAEVLCHAVLDETTVLNETTASSFFVPAY
jgi:hypothetical protein